jgi:aspartyl-tRNA(Asn)/glutamyl-tRNA(Gln) amidotransferase subunit B
MRAMMASTIFRSIQNRPLLLCPTALFRRKNDFLYCTMKSTEAQTATQENQKPPIKVPPRNQTKAIDKFSKNYEAVIGINSQKISSFPAASDVFVGVSLSTQILVIR